jgi:hypothetical protein
MSQSSITLVQNPVLAPEQDFYRLRREGVGFIEQTGSQAWTDYNTHDPGITTLEALCYAITDLGYRLGWDIQDILAPETASADPSQPYPNQAFFTARSILTVNPVTISDFRVLLIDLPMIHNAWLFAKACPCELSYYAWCQQDQLLLSYQAPVNIEPAPQRVSPLGLYEVLLELEIDSEFGDLNDRKVEFATTLYYDNVLPLYLELRFPEFDLSNANQWSLFLNSGDAFAQMNGQDFNLVLKRLGATKAFDLYSDPSLADDAARNTYLRNNWGNVLYLDLEIDLLPGGENLVITNIALRIFGDLTVKRQTTIAQNLKRLFQDKNAAGYLLSYQKKSLQAQIAKNSAKAALLSHRNLDEDYCSVKIVAVEDVAVCADIEVKADADIPSIQASIWFAIEQYLNPPIRFLSLAENLNSGVAVETLFNGPALNNGFIDGADLAAAELKTVLRVSDILKSLMEIDSVIAVNGLLLTKYDSEGNVLKGAADPAWTSDGQPIFDANKASAAWLLYVSSGHQPRLYQNLSNFRFYKNGLPFKANLDEAAGILNQLRGEAERPKTVSGGEDIPIPAGVYRNTEDYFPLQYGFPLVYGVGPSGLPGNACLQRKAQARQFKAYLLVYEQILGNALAQLAHTADLFSLDPQVTRTYFVKEINEALIQGFNDISNGLTKAAVESIAETPPEFLERRNRFLDHLLARFGEQFNDFALLLGNVDGEQVALDRLINNKITFLKAYPRLSHDRGKAIDYSLTPNASDNYAGVKKRISLLLGNPDLSFAWTGQDLGGGSFQIAFNLLDGNAKVWLQGSLQTKASSIEEAQQIAYAAVIKQISRTDAYLIKPESGKYRLSLQDSASAPLGNYPDLFDTNAAAAALQNDLLTWGAYERLIVVEHLLLRPKFPGDALYPVCSDAPCHTCGQDDPYSFRLSFVMPGWTQLFTDNLDMRRFADLTIQEETPSHLLGKTCWVGNDGFIENPCDEVIGRLAEVLLTQGLTSAGAPPVDLEACASANAVYHAFSAVFQTWYADKADVYMQPDALNSLIAAEFNSAPLPAGISSSVVLTPVLWSALQTLMIAYFQQIAQYGWQFERFESAWRQWLNVNAKFDWIEERLHERVQAILAVNLQTANAGTEAICQCAAAILNDCGMAFYKWMDGNIRSGLAFEKFPAFAPPPIKTCANLSFSAATADSIAALLKVRYSAYAEVSYRLWIVVNQLGQLRNIYPGAILHDCGVGGDQNPVLLDQTVLGNYPLGKSST